MSISYRHTKDFCCEDISLIENYDKAVEDDTQTWECHHRKGIDEGLSQKQLKKMGLYENRPASELIFLPESEHKRLHHLNKHLTAEHRKNIGKSKKGLPKSPEHRAKISASNKGKYVSVETRTKISVALAKSVCQIDPNTDEIIKVWKSISDAGKALNLNKGNISSCCRGRIKTAGGFVWKYVK